MTIPSVAREAAAEPHTAQTAPAGGRAVPAHTAALRSRRRSRRREALTFLAFTIPNLLLIAAFTYRPLLSNVYYSLLQWNMGAPTARFVGLDNYARWFTDPNSWNYLRITAIFTIATVGGTLVIGLAVATVLNQKLHGRGFEVVELHHPDKVDAPSGTSARTAPAPPSSLRTCCPGWPWGWSGCSCSTRSSGSSRR